MSFLIGIFDILILYRYKIKGFIKNNLIFAAFINFIFGFGLISNLFINWSEIITEGLDVIKSIQILLLEYRTLKII